MPIGKLEPVEWSRNRKGAKVEGLAVLVGASCGGELFPQRDRYETDAFSAP
jgi:hypothetical protein